MCKRLSMALLSILLIVSVVCAKQLLQDVIYVKDGSIIRGTIIEQIPNVSVKIQTEGCNVFVYRVEDIEKITREQPLKQHGIYERKSPWAALGWSLLGGFFLPIQGAGQWYNGEGVKGTAFFAVGLASAIALFSGLESENEGLATGGALVYLGSYIYSSVDAYNSAYRINRGHGYTFYRGKPGFAVTYDLIQDREPRIALEARVPF
ncbi:hypothetical protein E3J62_03150 [candidate division TA06 bacterium]|uniref:DUF5683 domain-containing protein n=1 Tax=candidate division TA06 bacterium TaxID=2250710 RepID=A0A523UWE0_UNCT6|nr:MAG: hypothetical protein E3J62_03150 [candidate division TA06 bacterium]